MYNRAFITPVQDGTRYLSTSIVSTDSRQTLKTGRIGDGLKTLAYVLVLFNSSRHINGGMQNQTYLLARLVLLQ